MKLMVVSRLWLFVFKARAPFYSLKALLKRLKLKAIGRAVSVSSGLSLAKLEEMHICHYT